MQDQFNDAFKNNFYLTGEFAKFCSDVTKISLNWGTFSGNKLPLLKNKNIAISNYSDELCAQMRGDKIAYLSVRQQLNAMAEDPSLFEYSLFLKTSYDLAAANFKTTFFHGLREGKKFVHQAEIIRQPNKQQIQDIYLIYCRQMARHNSFRFPLSFFEIFLGSPSALLLQIKYENNIIAYFCCFQHEDNIYASIGGGSPEYFKYKASNKLYDELIRYACANNLNIHLGIGEYKSGYQMFKQSAGLINYKMERFPDEDKILKLLMPLMKLKMTGVVLNIFSRVFPYATPYLVMPFT